MPRALGPSAWRRVAALGLTAAVPPSASRPFALAVPMLLIASVSVASVSVASRGHSDAIGTTLLRALIGAGPAVVIVGATHDVLEINPPIVASLLLLLVVWTTAARTLDASFVAALQSSAARQVVLIRMAAVGGVTAFVAGTIVRLLLAPSTTGERFAWMLSEEDDAHVVGVASDVLAAGPRGLQLAEQYGTAFIKIPLVLARAVGGLPSAKQDPRLQTITLFAVSTLVVITLAGLAMTLMTAPPHHVHRSTGRVAAGLPAALVAALGTILATTIGMWLLMELPMRTAFVWGLTIVPLGAGAVVALPVHAPPAARVVTLTHLVGIAVLLLSTWPFIVPALGALLLVPLLWVPWDRVMASAGHHPARWAGGRRRGALRLAPPRRGPTHGRRTQLLRGEDLLRHRRAGRLAGASHLRRPGRRGRDPDRPHHDHRPRGRAAGEPDGPADRRLMAADQSWRTSARGRYRGGDQEREPKPARPLPPRTRGCRHRNVAVGCLHVRPMDGGRFQRRTFPRASEDAPLRGRSDRRGDRRSR